MEQLAPVITPSGFQVRAVQATNREWAVVEAARAATGTVEGADKQKDFSLAVRLMQDFHTSPFEFAWFHCHVIVPRFVRDQMVRHRTLSFAEFSKRYSGQEVVEGNPYWIPNQTRTQGEGVNKQAGSGPASPSDHNWFVEALSRTSAVANKLYQEALNRGIERGQARALLPHNQMTSLHVAGNLKNWIDYLALRHHADAQEEHREVASAIGDLLIWHYPSLMKMADRFRFHNINLSSPEAALLAQVIGDCVDDDYKVTQAIQKALGEQADQNVWLSRGEMGRALDKLRKLFNV